eukprot:scaffold2134_cov65-Phaeocystis_antarctica.AAC.1
MRMRPRSPLSSASKLQPNRVQTASHPHPTRIPPPAPGVIEISSVPLAVVDVFHPKHFAELADASPTLGALNGACRMLFALSSNPDPNLNPNPNPNPKPHPNQARAACSSR